MRNMKVLFLDFDGPLHPTEVVRDFVYRGQDMGSLMGDMGLFRWVNALHACLAQKPDMSDVAIVVHSSWRRLLNNDQMRQALGPLAPQFMGITDTELGRYEGIMDMVQRLELGPEDYCVVDDAIDAYPANFGQLVVVNPLRGVQEPAVRRRIQQWAQAAPDSQREHAAPAAPVSAAAAIPASQTMPSRTATSAGRSGRDAPVAAATLMTASATAITAPGDRAWVEQRPRAR